MDYLLGMDSHLFRNVSAQYPRHKLDHFMVLGCLYGAVQQEYFSYLGQRQRSPLHSLRHKTQ